MAAAKEEETGLREIPSAVDCTENRKHDPGQIDSMAAPMEDTKSMNKNRLSLQLFAWFWQLTGFAIAQSERSRTSRGTVKTRSRSSRTSSSSSS